ncbi:phosphatase PAP2 family protein [Bacteroidales bacterium OttesenSCG-928-B11]|nr:phosphatase PAP2 family protein [Bacteroidales bacterium OttesenSCG-928-C03]MDL2312100.1 phosphatase PAP2 family protein [Bacteroidales bacterium OttesenSCG-928-B11]MDL2326072.1 phosphatase PAP2 family protein [Bacteroidales bacterium OttesenSCG-928-A14]
MLDKILDFDTWLFLFFNGFHVDWLDPIMFWLSNTFVWLPLYLLVIFLIIRKWKKKSILILIFLALTVTANDQTCNLLKRNIGRIRPSHDPALVGKVHLVEKSDGKLYKGGKFSFPSGHASNSVILVFYFAFFAKPRRKWTIMFIAAWSLLMCYTRLYLGVHYPLDLFCGLVMGSCFSLLFIWIWMRIQIRYSDNSSVYP